MRAIAIVLLFALSACASAPLWHAQEGVDYRVDVVDRQSERRFELEFVSLTSRPLCFATESWPFRGKIMTWEGREAAVHVAGHRYPIAEWNMGLCIPVREFHLSCGSRVNGGGRVSGYLSYDEFPDAPFDAAEPRSLEFNIAVGACHGGEERV